jgi:YD repeat-containing protein
MSDRDKTGLRGQVKTCEVHTTYPAPASFSTVEINEYTPDGRLLRRTMKYPNSPDSILVNTYDQQGRLTERRRGSSDQLYRVVFSYEKNEVWASSGSQKRLHSRLDDHGRRVEIEHIPELPEDFHGAVGATMWQESGLGFQTISGGSFETTYDEKDRPVEGRMLDRDGTLMSKVIRTFDSEGRPASDRLSVQDFPAFAPSPETAGQFNPEQIKGIAAFFGKRMEGSAEYEYDSLGRLLKHHIASGLQEETTTFSYNEHNDKILEHKTTSTPAGMNFEYGMDATGNMVPVKQPSPPPPTVSETRYEYVYDSAGNWVERTTAYAHEEGVVPVPGTVTQRLITYY